MKTTIVLPTYNEADNLPKMVAALLALPLTDLNVLVVDDNSPDGTGKVADDLVAKHPGRVDVIHRMGKNGLGTAYLAGFGWALERGADIIIQMDADFSHSPNYIPQMLDRIGEYDVVVGSRYVKGGKLDERWEYGRYLLSWFANSIYARLILGAKTQDTTAGFKAWKRETLLGMGLERVRSNGYVFQVEMAYIVERLGYRVLEIPIYFEDRRIGKSKMSIPVKIEAALRTWQVRLRHGHLRPKDRKAS
jgi:dolichol-phosphate mannosyltransferase